jgi:TfoX/Sxy family transcriptional regulator of competence genes
MPLDEAFAQRVRELMEPRPGLTERRMFGGIGFMVDGNMATGVSSRGMLIVRVDPEDAERARREPGAEAFEMNGRVAKGFVLVSQDVLGDDAELAHWVDAGANYAQSLPPK